MKETNESKSYNLRQDFDKKTAKYFIKFVI